MHAGATQSTAWRVPDEVGRRTRRAEGGELAVRRIRAGFEPFRGLSHPLALANQVEGSEWRIGVGALRRGSKPARTCLVR
jgi:hypothetical protein